MPGAVGGAVGVDVGAGWSVLGARWGRLDA
jgi:hypothetical protein